MDLRGLTDEKLLQLIKADDEKAFKEIYSRYWKLLFEAAYRRLASKEVAKELVQATFLRIWEKRHITYINHLQSYLQTTIKNKVINYIAATITHKKYLQYMMDTTAGNYATAESVTHYKDLTVAIERAINLLPEKTRHIFRLSRFDHQSVREIAASLDLSEKAVEYHITQSLKTLRLRLKDFVNLL